MATSSVQFFGSDAVLTAFESRAIQTWALFQGKQLLTTGSGSDELSAFLTMLEPGGSSAIYTLKVYRDIEDPFCITDKTESNGGFNFKLTASGAAAFGAVNGGAVRYGGTDMIQQKLNSVIAAEVSEAIDRRLNGSADTEKKTLSGIIMGYLEEPEKLVPLLPVLQALRGLFSPAGAVGMPVSLAGVNDATVRRVGSTVGVYADGTAERLATVINKLEQQDPDILKHLEQLSALADKNPALFSMLLKQLETM